MDRQRSTNPARTPRSGAGLDRVDAGWLAIGSSVTELAGWSTTPLHEPEALYPLVEESPPGYRELGIR